jgi:hypothetical protein
MVHLSSVSPIFYPKGHVVATYLLSEGLGLVVHLADGGLGALAHPAAPRGGGLHQLAQHILLRLLLL